MTLKNIKKLKLWLMEQNSLWDVDIDLNRNGNMGEEIIIKKENFK